MVSGALLLFQAFLCHPRIPVDGGIVLDGWYSVALYTSASLHCFACDQLLHRHRRLPCCSILALRDHNSSFTIDCSRTNQPTPFPPSFLERKKLVVRRQGSLTSCSGSKKSLEQPKVHTLEVENYSYTNQPLSAVSLSPRDTHIGLSWDQTVLAIIIPYGFCRHPITVDSRSPSPTQPPT